MIDEADLSLLYGSFALYHDTFYLKMMNKLELKVCKALVETEGKEKALEILINFSNKHWNKFYNKNTDTSKPYYERRLPMDNYVQDRTYFFKRFTTLYFPKTRKYLNEGDKQ